MMTRRRYFNSIKVRLELQPWICSCGWERNFNSIKVRLEHVWRVPHAVRLQQFQFHKGTIRTVDEYYSSFAPKFQFHKGTIRTVSIFFSYHGNLYFNSIKVRLERGLALLMMINYSYFNSIKVRLELKPISYM